IIIKSLLIVSYKNYLSILFQYYGFFYYPSSSKIVIGWFCLLGITILSVLSFSSKKDNPLKAFLLITIILFFIPNSILFEFNKGRTDVFIFNILWILTLVFVLKLKFIPIKLNLPS